MKSVLFLVMAGLWVEVSAAAADTNALATAHSLSLEEAYDRALATDQSIRIAYAEVKRNDLLPWSALTRMGPRLTGNGGYSRPESEITTPQGPVLVRNWHADVTVQQPLIDATVFPAYRAGKLSAQAARLAHQFTVRNILFAVTRAYYEVLKAERIVSVNRQTLDLAEQQLELARHRFNAGEVAKTDVLRAQVTVERARRTLTTAENSRQLSATILSNTLNWGRDTHFSVLDPPRADAEIEPLEAQQNRATEQREDLRVARLTIEQSRQHEREVRAQYWPRLLAQWSNQWVDPETTASRNDFWQAGVAVQIPLFSGGQRELDLKRTRLETEESRLNRESLVKSVEIDVQQAWLNVRSLAQSLQALEAEVAAAEENLRNLQNQYRAGAATSLDVQNALTDLSTSRTDQAIQTYDYQVARRNLDRATGLFQQARIVRLTHR
jgi:outer membrane protein